MLSSHALLWELVVFLVQAGPESAGAHPGPLCYRKGGYAAITDANLVLGRILPEFFPNIFGEHEVPSLAGPLWHALCTGGALGSRQAGSADSMVTRSACAAGSTTGC